LSELRRSHPKLAFVIGTDQLEQLKNWHRFPELIHLCSWIVLERQPMGHEVSQKTLQTWAASGLITPVSAGNGTSQWEIRGQDGRSGKAIITVPTEAPELSSTNIRENMAKGTPIDELGLFPPVAAYLKENRLYGIYQGS
ncbi:MAG: hypothetical protein HYX41_08160, partial [Bdellovibrio sp.]|nr:hypothetical protein [Bdellovibrio sp.]